MRYAPATRFNDELSPELESELKRGEIYESLVQSEAWTLLLDWLESRSNTVLREMRQDKSGSEKLAIDRLRRMQITDELIADLQHEVLGAVEHRRSTLLALAKATNAGEDYE